MGDNSNFVFCQKLVGEDGSVRRCVVTVKQPGLFSPKFGDYVFALFHAEPVGMPHNQLPPPQQCREWSDVDPDG